MSYMNYKEGTGVRSRSDLSPNPRGQEAQPMTLDHVAKAAEWLSGELKKSRKRGGHSVTMPNATAERLVDAMLLVVNAGTRP